MPYLHSMNYTVTLQVHDKRYNIKAGLLSTTSKRFHWMLAAPESDATPWPVPARTADGAYVVQANPFVFEHIIAYLETARYPLLWTQADGFDIGMYAQILSLARQYLFSDLARWIEEEKYNAIISNAINTDVVTLDTVHGRSGVRANYDGNTTLSVKLMENVEEHWVCPASHSDPSLCECTEPKVLRKQHVVKLSTVSKATVVKWELLAVMHDAGSMYSQGEAQSRMSSMSSVPGNAGPMNAHRRVSSKSSVPESRSHHE